MRCALKPVEVLARIFSGGGGVAHRLGGLWLRRFPWLRISWEAQRRHALSLQPQAWPWIQGVVALFLVISGLAIVGASVDRTGQPTSLEQVAQIDSGQPDHGGMWKTVSGTVRTWTSDPGTDGNGAQSYLYLLTNDGSSLGLIVRGPEGLGEPGSRATITGYLIDPRYGRPGWSSAVVWAQAQLPNGRVIRTLEFDVKAPAPAFAIPGGLAVAFFGIWIFVAALAGYAVFLPLPGAGIPAGAAMLLSLPSSASIHLSGLVRDNYGRDIWLRDKAADISRRQDSSGDSATIECEGFPKLEIEAGSDCRARAGTTFVLRAARPALSVVDRTGRRVTIAFADEATRNDWLGLMTR
jgi:hypothetical protein